MEIKYFIGLVLLVCGLSIDRTEAACKTQAMPPTTTSNTMTTTVSSTVSYISSGISAPSRSTSVSPNTEQVTTFSSTGSSETSVSTSVSPNTEQVTTFSSTGSSETSVSTSVSPNTEQVTTFSSTGSSETSVSTSVSTTTTTTTSTTTTTTTTSTTTTTTTTISAGLRIIARVNVTGPANLLLAIQTPPGSRTATQNATIEAEKLRIKTLMEASVPGLIVTDVILIPIVAKRRRQSELLQNVSDLTQLGMFVRYVPDNYETFCLSCKNTINGIYNDSPVEISIYHQNNGFSVTC